MPKPVRPITSDSDLLGLRTVIVHVGPVRKTRSTAAPGEMLIEGNGARLRENMAARALLLLFLGSASWAAVAISASLVRRVIA